VVKQLGGGLSVRSALEEGTSVSIFLPRVGPGSAESAAKAEEPPVTPVVEAVSGSRARILLVDDDADVRSTAADMLGDAGYEVVQASSGAAALDTLERVGSRTELVLVDIAMPGINGIELAAIVRRTWPALPVLLMTGYADSALLRKGAGLEILRKPFQSTELEATVRRALTGTRTA